MKLYSKKYLAMLLAGVMVTSMPVAAFAEENTGSGNSTEITQPEKTELDKAKESAKSYIDGLRYLTEPEKRRAANEVENATDKSGVEEALKKAIDKNKEYEREEDRDVNKEDLSIRNLKYDGKRVTGRTHEYAKIFVKVGNGRYERLGTADRDGYFDYKLDLRKGERAYIYAEYDGVEGRESTIYDRERDDKELDVTNLEISGYELSGTIKNHPWEEIKIYLNGRYLATARTDKNGDFSVRLDSRIYESDLRDLTFYTENKVTVENKDLKVTRALEGEKLLMGTTRGLEEVRVLSGSKELGKAEAVRTGDFTVFLDRALTAGEKLTLESKDSDGKVSKIDFVVTKKAQAQRQLAYIEGYPNGTFKPSNNMTRAEAAKMFATLINGGTNFGTSKTTKFTDANDDWYSEAINFIVQKGFINGYEDGTFKPNEKITRAEFAKMISGYINDSNTNKADFVDAKDHWAKDAIDKLYGNKNIKGYPDGTFKPNADITRAEAVTILNSVFNRFTTSASLSNVSTAGLKTFSDVDGSHWAYYNILDASNTHTSEKLNPDSEIDIWK